MNNKMTKNLHRTVALLAITIILTSALSTAAPPERGKPERGRKPVGKVTGPVRGKPRSAGGSGNLGCL